MYNLGNKKSFAVLCVIILINFVGVKNEKAEQSA